MSALNFVNNKLAQMAIVPSKKDKQKQPDNNQKSKNTKKKFTHGNNVILKNGTFKGYYGFVYNFNPAQVEVQFDEEQYIMSRQYGQQEIGNKLMTDFGEATVVEKVPVLYGIQVKAQSRLVELRFRDSDLIRVVAFTDSDGLMKAGKLINVQPIENDLQCELQPFVLAYQPGQSEMEVFNMLAESLKAGNVEVTTQENCTGKQVRFPEVYLVTEPSHLGLFGPLTRVIDEQYLVRYKKTIPIQKKSVTSANGKKLAVGSKMEIKNGPFKGKIGELAVIHEPELTVFIDAVSRKVTTHSVRQENGKYKTKSITPSDVFYMDIRLKNGNFMEVTDVLDDGKIVGIMKSDGGYIPVTITKDEIESLQPGFSFTEQKQVHTSDVDTEFVQETESPLETEEIDDSEDTDNPDPDSMYDQGEEGTYADAPDEQEMRFTFKDIERTAFTPPELTNTQKELMTKIQNVLQQYGGYDVNAYKVLEDVEGAIKQIKSMLAQSNAVRKMFWNKTDEKYIIACLVLFEIVRMGYNHALNTQDGDIIGTFIKQLSDNNFFNRNDVSNSIFLTNGWSTAFTVHAPTIQAHLSTRNRYIVHRIMFENCNQVLQQWFGPVSLNVNLNLHELNLIPLGTKPKEEATRKVITAREFLGGDYPSTAERIIWGPSYQDILTNYKSLLQDAVNGAPNKTTAAIYTYVLDNLERAPFALKEQEANFNKTKLKIDKAKFDKLGKIWSVILKKLKAKYIASMHDKQLKQHSVQEERERISKRRREIYEENVLNDKFGDLSLIEDDEDQDESEPKKERIETMAQMMKRLTTKSRREHTQAEKKKQKRDLEAQNVNDSTEDSTEGTPEQSNEEFDEAYEFLKEFERK